MHWWDTVDWSLTIQHLALAALVVVSAFLRFYGGKRDT